MEEFYNQHALFFNTSGYVLGIISFLYSVYTYQKTKTRKQISYSAITMPIIGAKTILVEKGKPIFKNKAIQTRLVLTKIILFNAGNQTLSDDDIAKIAKIKILLPKEVLIYAVEVVFVNNPANNIQITKNEGNDYFVKFDYLDRNDGCIIHIFHDQWLKHPPKLEGAIKGGKRRYYIEYWRFITNQRPGELRPMSRFTVFGSILSLLILLPFIWNAKSKETFMSFYPYRKYITIGIVILCILLIRSIIPKNRLPQTLKTALLSYKVSDTLARIQGLHEEQTK